MKFRIKSNESLNNSPRIKLNDGYMYNFNKSNTDHITIYTRYHVPFSHIIDVDLWSKDNLNGVYYYARRGSFVFIDAIEEEL